MDALLIRRTSTQFVWLIQFHAPLAKWRCADHPATAISVLKTSDYKDRRAERIKFAAVEFASSTTPMITVVHATMHVPIKTVRARMGRAFARLRLPPRQRQPRRRRRRPPRSPRRQHRLPPQQRTRLAAHRALTLLLISTFLVPDQCMCRLTFRFVLMIALLRTSSIICHLEPLSKPIRIPMASAKYLQILTSLFRSFVRHQRDSD